MTKYFVLFGAFCVTLSASPIQVTISLSGGSFDRGVTTSGLDTGLTFQTSATSCTGGGCSAISSLLQNLNGDTFAFTVTSASPTGNVSVLTGTLLQSQNLNGFIFNGQSSFTQNSAFSENIGAAGILGNATPLSGTLSLSWSGNSSVQARSATGSIVLNGDVTNTAATNTPEPSTVLLLALSFAGLIAQRLRARRVATRS